jgi:hypothetical protein
MSGGFNMSLFSFMAILDGFNAGIAIQQNGSVYLPRNVYGLGDNAPRWYGGTNIYTSGVGIAVGSSSDWARVSGDGPIPPDFSGTGSTIQFGLIVSGYFYSGSGTITGGIDNWTINVDHSVPVPLPPFKAQWPSPVVSR